MELIQSKNLNLIECQDGIETRFDVIINFKRLLGMPYLVGRHGPGSSDGHSGTRLELRPVISSSHIDAACRYMSTAKPEDMKLCPKPSKLRLDTAQR